MLLYEVGWSAFKWNQLLNQNWRMDVLLCCITSISLTAKRNAMPSKTAYLKRNLTDILHLQFYQLKKNKSMSLSELVVHWQSNNYNLLEMFNYTFFLHWLVKNLLKTSGLVMKFDLVISFISLLKEI